MSETVRANPPRQTATPQAPTVNARTKEQDAEVHRVEMFISYLLRAGVFSSMAVLAMGVVMTLKHHPDYFYSHGAYAHLTGPDMVFPHSIHEVVAGVRDHRGISLMAAGLLLLIATPVLRVAASIVVFVRQKNPTFVVITTIVLVLLLLSFVLGKGEVSQTTNQAAATHAPGGTGGGPTP